MPDYTFPWIGDSKAAVNGVIDVDATIKRAEETGVYDEAYGEAALIRKMYECGLLDEYEVKETNVV